MACRRPAVTWSFMALPIDCASNQCCHDDTMHSLPYFPCANNGDEVSVDMCCSASLEPEHLAVKLMP